MKVRVTEGRLKHKELELATRQAEAAVAAGWAEFVDPRPNRPADVERPPVPTGSWLGPPGEAPAPPATGDVTGSWLGPPGEKPAPTATPVLLPEAPGSWLGPPGEAAPAVPAAAQTSALPAEPAPPPDSMLDVIPESPRPPDVSAPPASSRKRGGSR